MKKNNSLAFIGGSGFYDLEHCCPRVLPVQTTPYGPVKGIHSGVIEDTTIYFLPRHGGDHKLLPHQINYRANIWALRALGVDKVVAFNAVGGIEQGPGILVLPDQIIDYTYGREHTYADATKGDILHVDFSLPICPALRSCLKQVLSRYALPAVDGGIYGCTQGPRLESAAEINRLSRDGCTLVGMTMMPEAALARELEMRYASICIVVNWAAGRSEQLITLDAINTVLKTSISSLKTLLPELCIAILSTSGE